jgi:RNA methyltransferase, TrmH family
LRIDLLRIFLSHLHFLLLRDSAAQQGARDDNANEKTLHECSGDESPEETHGQILFHELSRSYFVKLLTLARDLRRRKAREKHSLFVAEGVRAVEELLRSGLVIRGAIATADLAAVPRGAALRERLAGSGCDVLEVSQKDFDTAAETESPQGLLAIAEIPRRALNTLELPSECRILVLDAVQDPGNVGALVRTAAALGANATIALAGTVDLWNPKVVRSSMGAQFHHPALHATWEETSVFLDRQGVEIWAADASGEPLDTGRAVRRLAIVVGNEGSGLNPGIRARARKIVSLPIAATVESLNVAVAAGIILYELRQ